MIAFTQTARKTLRRIQKGARIRKEISQMNGQTDQVPKQMARIIKEVLNDILIDTERAAVQNIEQLRQDMLGSRVTIAKQDFGAGSPDAKLSKKQMQSGRVVEQSVAEICAMTSKDPKWALLLFKMVRFFKPFICLELGTSVGISCCYQASALKLNGEGRIVSIEGSEDVAGIARANINDLGLNNASVFTGRFDERLKEVLEELVEVDFAFIDGHHDKRATLEYFETIHPYLSNQAVLVFDDINWSEGMKKAWSQITADPRIKYSFDLNAMGICFLDQGCKTKSHFKVEL